MPMQFLHKNATIFFPPNKSFDKALIFAKWENIIAKAAEIQLRCYGKRHHKKGQPKLTS